jgi:hypothetical protein
MRNYYRSELFKNTTALGANALYSGTGYECLHYERITGYASSDQAGTISINQSDNGTDWYETHTVAVAAGSTKGTPYSVDLVARFVKVDYVNGATAQTLFKIVGFLSE